MNKADFNYYRKGFPGAFREFLARVQRPDPWYWWIITIWFYPFLAYIGLTIQAHDNAELAKQQRRLREETR